MTDHSEFEQRIAANIKPILVVIVIGISGFLLGANYGKKSDASQLQNTVASPTPASGQSAISNIQQAIIGTPSSVTSNNSTELSDQASTKEQPASSADQKQGLININTASLSELDGLPGIGPVYAQRIIDYRSQNGPFLRTEDIMNIKGIGQKTFDKLKDKITI